MKPFVIYLVLLFMLCVAKGNSVINSSLSERMNFCW